MFRSSCSLSPTGTHLPPSQLSHIPLDPSFTAARRQTQLQELLQVSQCLPACVPADWRGWGLEIYLLSQVCTPAVEWLMSCQFFPWAALALLCLGFLLWPCCKCREGGTTDSPLGWMEITPVNQLYSTYKQGGSFGSHPNLIPSETKSPYSAGCLPFCNEGKTIIANCLTSWAQTQEKTCHNYWQGMHCRVTGILVLLIILFL